MEPEDNGKVPVTILVNNLSSPDYVQTRAMVDVGRVCSNLSFCIYPCEGESFDKIQINQSRGEESFGTVSQNLTVGVHKIVVVAHNGDKNATMTNPESIAFSSNTILKTTDTYCWAGEVNVTQETGTISNPYTSQTNYIGKKRPLMHSAGAALFVSLEGTTTLIFRVATEPVYIRLFPEPQAMPTFSPITW